MKISHVVDTCALLDLVAGKWTNFASIEALEKASLPVVHTLSAWEIARKLRLGKLDLPCEVEGLRGFLDEVLQHYQLTWFPLDAQVACEAELLPMHHKDPVDRMILSLCKVHAIPVFTSDRQFALYEGIQILNHRS